jgi:predicted TIM-barrel fold metal-dependent hydrolase
VIVDCHVHLASPSQIPGCFFDGWADTVARSLPPGSEALSERLRELFRELNSDAHGKELVREMDAAGIDKAIVLVVDFGLAFPESSSTLDAAHDEVLAVVSASNRFIPFAGVDPRRGQAGVDWFERAVKRGFAGLKLYPPCGFSPSDPQLDPYYEICAAYNLPVLTHTGPTSSVLPFRYAHPLEVDEAACRFPKVNFILAHGAVMWEDVAARLAEHRPNVYLDLSGFQSELQDNHLDEILKSHLRRRLSGRILFGTDWPMHRFFGGQKTWVDALSQVYERKAISRSELDRMFFGNIQRLLPRHLA